MNCYKVGYAAVWTSGEGPNPDRSVKEGTVNVLAIDGTHAGQIAEASISGSPAEVQIRHVQEVARDVISASSFPHFALQVEQVRDVAPVIHEESGTLEGGA